VRMRRLELESERCSRLISYPLFHISF